MFCANPPVLVELCGPLFPPRKKMFEGAKLPLGIGGAAWTVPLLLEIDMLKLFRCG